MAKNFKKRKLVDEEFFPEANRSVVNSKNNDALIYYDLDTLNKPTLTKKFVKSSVIKTSREPVSMEIKEPEYDPLPPAAMEIEDCNDVIVLNSPSKRETDAFSQILKYQRKIEFYRRKIEYIRNKIYDQ